MELELKFAELACCEPVGDLVASVCISQMEGELDHEIFNQGEAKKAA